jgi:methanogenic corrinoid protein MtbC1
MVDLREISRSIESGDAQKTSTLVNSAIAENCSFDCIIKKGFIPGMQAVTERFKRDEILIPELRIAERALNVGIRRVKLAIASFCREQGGVVVIGTVSGDTEETLKNLIIIMMECRGLRVIDLGTDVSHDRFIEAALAEKACLIICSAMLLTTMAHMKTLVQAAAGIRNQTKIMITGIPVTEQYCRIIGADLYAPNAEQAAELAVSYCTESAAPQGGGLVY